jgi:hypothetical protein
LLDLRFAVFFTALRAVLFFAVERFAVERFAAFLTAFFGALRAVFFAAT